MMTCADACEMKFYFEYCCQLSPLAINPDLHAGGALAHALEITRKAFYADDIPLEPAILMGISAMIEFWGDFEPPPKNPKTLVAMITAFEDYFREYPPADDLYQPLILADGKPAIEFTFALPTRVRHPITGDPIVYAGRCDMISNYNNEFICIVDEKTTKNFSWNYTEQWGMRQQFIGYCYAAQVYGFEDVRRALIRGIAIQITQIKHIQILEEYPQWKMDAWWETMQRKLERLVTSWTNQWFFHSYGDACTSYGNCTFLNTLCREEDPSDKFGDFAHREWNPLAKNPTEVTAAAFEDIGTLADLMEGVSDRR